MNYRFFSSAPLFALVLSACGQGASDIPEGMGSVTLALRAGGDTPATMTTAGDADLQLERATAFIRHIELELPEDVSCAEVDSYDHACTDGKLVIEGPWVVDLMNGDAPPALTDVLIPAGVYRRIDIRFDDAEEAQQELPEQLRGRTLYAEGTYSGDIAERFELALEFNEDARFESDTGLTVESQSAQDLLLLMDASTWFSGIDLADCEADGDLEVQDGVLSLDDSDSSCSDVEGQLKEAIKRSGQLDR